MGKGGKAWGAPPFPDMLRPFKINRGYFPALALGKKSCLPSSWKLAMAFWVLGLIHQLMNYLAASCLTFGHLAGLTIMTLYWFRRALSPSTRIFRGASPLAAALYLM